jgi:Domain of unknown function (DUF4390)
MFVVLRQCGPHGVWLLTLKWLLLIVIGLAAVAFRPGARAQSAQPEGIEVTALSVARLDQGLSLDFSARIWPNRTVEDALQRGIAVYFVAEAAVYRPRWYWRDERVSRVSRNWRVSYQPLTNTWRVGSGGLSQTVASQSEALSLISRISGWRITEGGRLAADERYYVEFSYRLDTSQLPRPMQLSVGALNEWSLEFERTMAVE